MKIFHIGKHYWPSVGGMETAIRDLAEAGVRLGHEVSCAVSQTKSPWTERTVLGGVQLTRGGTFGRLLSTPLSPSLLMQALPSSGIVHVHLPNPFAELRILKSLLNLERKKYQIVPYLHALPLSQGVLGEYWFSGITAKILDEAPMILVSNSNFIKAFPQVKRWESKIRIVPFRTEILDSEAFMALRPHREISDWVVSVGRLVGYKGFDELIRAWAKMKRQGAAFSRFKLRIIGQGPEHAALLARIDKERVSDSVVLSGEVSELEKERYLRESMLFVAPSLTCAETFGISMLEGMGRGLPVITTRLPTGVATLARGGLCGACVEPGSVEELSQALQTLLAYSQNRHQAGLANLEHVRVHHSDTALLSQYEQVIAELTGSSKEDSSEDRLRKSHFSA